MSKLVVHSPSAPLECNCMATRHAFSCSCTGCGWIACQKYTESKCPMCSTEMFPLIPASELDSAIHDASSLKAYKMLHKLLQFDQENAKRTHVHDAQADYYESGTWLTEEEKADIAKREAMRMEAKKRQSQRRVNIRFDIAGRRVVDFINEEDDGLGACADDFVGCKDVRDARPDWMYEEESALEGTACSVVSGGTAAGKGTGTGTGNSPTSAGCSTGVGFQAGSLGSSNSDSTGRSNMVSGGEELPAYENLALESDRGKAGELYRQMKKR
jgi:hypothetical protein